MKGDTSMEIIIRMEEKENPTVGAALREMTSNHWVQAILPKCTERAKNGYTYYTITCSDNSVPHETRTLVKETFKKLGIDFSESYQGKGYYELTFSW
jgi:hypothetical protein